MPVQSDEVTVELLQAFADAWNRHDVGDLMSFMTEDCVFESSAGDDVCGTRYEGAEAGLLVLFAAEQKHQRYMQPFTPGLR